MPVYMHAYKVNLNSCFECSNEYLTRDLANSFGKPFEEHYFDKTKRMVEFNRLSGHLGVKKFCYDCNIECVNIADEDVDIPD